MPRHAQSGVSKSGGISEKLSKIFKKSKKSKSSASLTKKDANATKRKYSTSSGASAALQQHHALQQLQYAQQRELPACNASNPAAQSDILLAAHSGAGNAESAMDSDLDESRLSGCQLGQIGASGTVVQFQTQTRASSYRTRNSGCLPSAPSQSASPTNTPANSNAEPGNRQKLRAIKVSGSRRRKGSTRPRKNYKHSVEGNAPFFDPDEWSERKSCCGPVWECVALGGSLIVDLDKYVPCAEHGKRSAAKAAAAADPPLATQKQTIATLPAVVQLKPHHKPLAPPPAPLPCTAAATAHTPSPTPVLKKHHLFFKRQSECFPTLIAASSHNDSGIGADSNMAAVAVPSYPTCPANADIKTESLSSAAAAAAAAAVGSYSFGGATITPAILTPLNSLQQQAPRHSTAKITTISASAAAASGYHSMQAPSSHQPHLQHHQLQPSPVSLPSSTTATVSLAGSTGAGKSLHHFLHKIKADFGTGKVVKHSLDKLSNMNTTVSSTTTAAVAAASTGSGLRIKSHDMQHLIKTADKTYVLAKPSQVATSQAAPTSAPYHSLIASSLPSPGSSSTKFSDNSSDSGFDENMQDRKSASPLQEDTERKMHARLAHNQMVAGHVVGGGGSGGVTGGVQTMFLASGVQIQGQQQNLLLTGNEVAAKMLQNRKQHQQQQIPMSSNVLHQHNNNRANSSNLPSVTSVKIAQIVGTTANTTISNNTSIISSLGGSHHTKMRAIYNHNNNTIQHENGVTTIVPASSLAASSQAAAMSAIAPSTVTITPAPLHHAVNSMQQHHQQQQQQQHHVSLAVMPSGVGGGTRKMHTVIGSGNTSIAVVPSGATYNNNNTNNNNLMPSNGAGNALNQKIILVKTSKYNSGPSGGGGNNNTSATTSAVVNPSSLCKNVL